MRRPAAAALGPLLAAALLLVASWLLLTHVPFWQHDQQSDAAVYQAYGTRVLDGDVPYRDFALEYPPAALPAFVLPALGHPGAAAYRWRFEWLMALCALLALAALDVAARSLRLSGRARLGILLAAGVFPLVLGPVVLTRFDFWPAALAAAALAAYLRDRGRLGGALLGLAAAAKVFPIVLAPAALAYLWRRRGGREALGSLVALAAVLAACFLPFAALAPRGTLHPFLFALHRPLEIESLGAGLLLAAHHLAGLSLGSETSYGSVNLGGSKASLVAAATSALELAALAWVWWTSCLRRRPGREELVTAAAAALAATVAFGKVFSPQYLVWLLAAVPLVERRVRAAALALLLLAGGLTQAWFPRRFDRLERLAAAESWLVLARDLVVVALAVLVARALAAGAVASERAVELGGAVGHPGD